ncbi:ADP-ribosylglycohydrolase [Paraburkholderia sp. HC6.4b]|uniref:ADP-ribosylglycohydrolase family protein n=1 Tax=unclassified Paraburkholderia TaxID=2615204 RepID=UPI00161BA882|nr:MULTISPECIES: ADP-ribosylglycohydrolase family protein [unclassified Paraburkholderia]MBB5413954.1 ADP-ribosylglycohydrolase [Paraburkholderia sp. HC6.4b]MBB5456352.1 ADP-ribosylglycohydrolase [Paraburkholderia sp. Kb1A]
MEQGIGFIGLRDVADARIAGLVGLLVGDALGVGFEFKKPEQIPRRDQIEMTTPAAFRRSHAGVPVGTWSDDGSQALCLLASLLKCGKLSLIDFANRLLRWRDDGYLAVDGDVFDIGIQTAYALNRLRDGASPRESGGRAEWCNGNGSVMRILPLALWHVGTDEALVEDAHLQSLPTHAHPRSLVACAWYVLVARAYLRKLADPWSWADQRLEEIYRGWLDERERAALRAELDVLRSFPKTDQPRGTGYVIDTIWSAGKAMEEESFEDVARSAILFGNDTDTTAAVACGLAGIKFGIDGIPARWLEQLRGYEIVQSMIGRLVRHDGIERHYTR